MSALEIESFISSYVRGEVPDYIASAFLMAVFIRGMDADETFWLTQAMMRSGEVISPGSIQGYAIDKHSTGGVGDKVTIALVPLAAACGLKIPMISGRGLGHTGGTLDKLEAIPGLRTELSLDEFVGNVNEIGASIMGQSSQLVPADMKLYALRDVTGTVESIPLITASIMSKKLAEGIDGLVMDIKVGSGAFMSKDSDAEELANAIMDVCRRMGKKSVAVLTDMSQPLGHTVGNAIETREALEALKGNGPADLMEVVYLLGEQMLVMAGAASTADDARNDMIACIENGKAFAKFKEIVSRQGGDVEYVVDPELLDVADTACTIESEDDGFVEEIDTWKIGSACVGLGAGRELVGEKIDRSAGLIIEKKIGSSVKRGEPLLRILCKDPSKIEPARKILSRAYKIVKHSVAPPRILRKMIS